MAVNGFSILAQWRCIVAIQKKAATRKQGAKLAGFTVNHIYVALAVMYQHLNICNYHAVGHSQGNVVGVAWKYSAYLFFAFRLIT